MGAAPWTFPCPVTQCALAQSPRPSPRSPGAAAAFFSALARFTNPFHCVPSPGQQGLIQHRPVSCCWGGQGWSGRNICVTWKARFSQRAGEAIPREGHAGRPPSATRHLTSHTGNDAHVRPSSKLLQPTWRTAPECNSSQPCVDARKRPQPWAGTVRTLLRCVQVPVIQQGPAGGRHGGCTPEDRARGVEHRGTPHSRGHSVGAHPRVDSRTARVEMVR